MKLLPISSTPTVQRPGTFKTIYTVALDTLANKTYDFNRTKLKERAEGCTNAYPKISKVTSFGLRYTYGLGLAYAERLISAHTGPIVSSTIVYSHPFLLSKLYSWLNSKICPTEMEHSTKKPSIATYSGTFALLENCSIPLYFGLMGAIATFSNPISPQLAVLAVGLANLAAVIVEFVGFTVIWSKKVLLDVPKGKLSDLYHGFFDEFHPFKIYSSKHEPHPAKSTFEYIGQLWGVIESYCIWIQLTRLVYAVAMVLTIPVTPIQFVDSFVGFTAKWGFGVVSGLFTAKYTDSLSDKIEENNNSVYPASSIPPTHQ